MVFKGNDRSDDSSGMVSKSQTSKFLGKARSGNSQYTSTNSSFGIDCSKLTERDVQEEFHRIYTQLELLKQKNMRVGNRHLASKIVAMQDAASRHDYEQSDDMDLAGTNCRLNNMLCVVTENVVSATSVSSENVPKVKRQSVSFAQTSSDAAGSSTSKDSCAGVEEVAVEESPSKTNAAIELNSNREDRGDNNSRNGRLLKSGHARTHGIVINLDDKSRFTEEVTV